MENRLVFFSQQNNLNRPLRAPRGIEVREAVIDRTHAAQERLADQAGSPLVREAVAIAENPQALRMRLGRTFEDVPVHANDIARGYAMRLTPERQRAVLNGIHAGGALTSELEEIMLAVTTVVDTSNGTIEHRYLQSKEGAAAGGRSWYGIDFKRIDADKRIVAGLKASHPALAADLTEVERALYEYARPDPSLPADRWGTIERNAGDKQILGMARLAGIIVAGSAAVLTGILAIGRRDGFKAPLLYAGIAGLLAYPEIRRTFFGSTAENALAQVDATVNTRDFKENVRRYDISGQTWSTFAEDVMHSSGTTASFLKELSRHPPDTAYMRPKVEEYVQEMMPAGGAREQLRAMIMNKHFPAFAQRLMAARDSDAQEVVLEYIGRGAWQFENMAQKSADEANALMERSSRRYLSGSQQAPGR